MKRSTVCLLALLLALPARAQQGFDVDPLPPALGAADAFSTREARLAPGISAGLGLDWSWHLLRDDLVPGGAWLAEQRLRTFAGAQVTIGRKLRLAASAGYTPWQRGRRYDELGRFEKLGPGSGAARLTVGWLAAATDRLAVLLECGLRLPAASPAALSGDPDWGTSLTLLLSLRTGPGVLLANFGLTTRRRNLFRNLAWDDGWHAGLAGLIGPDGWPVLPVLDLRTEGVLAPAGHGALLATQVLAGVRIKLGPGDLLLGAGRGIYGLLVPGWRVYVRLTISTGEKKIRHRLE